MNKYPAGSKSQISYARQDVTDNDVAAVIESLTSDFLTIGPKVEEFESMLSNYVNSEIVVVSSGTAALHVAYSIIGIKPGDEIITSPLTFIATQATAALLGASIKFVDIDPLTGNLDHEKLENVITKNTRAVVTVDFAGHPGNLDRLLEITKKHNIFLIEDAAHSLGSTFQTRKVGSIADITTFSFFATKNITTGEGGAIASTNSELIKKARRFSHQGLIRNKDEFKILGEGDWHQEVHEFGLNYRLSDINCALGISQLKRIDVIKMRRQEIHDIYNAHFEDEDQLTLPTKLPEVEPLWHLYPLRVPAKKRKAVFNYLRANEIMVQVNYLPAYRHPVFGFDHAEFMKYPNTEKYYAEEISLPLHNKLSNSDIDKITELVKSGLLQS